MGFLKTLSYSILEQKAGVVVRRDLYGWLAENLYKKEHLSLNRVSKDGCTMKTDI